MSEGQKRVLHSYAGPIVAAVIFLVGFAWQLRAYATLPERVEHLETWRGQHQSEVIDIRLEIERRLSRIESKIDEIRAKP